MKQEIVCLILEVFCRCKRCGKKVVETQCPRCKEKGELESWETNKGKMVVKK